MSKRSAVVIGATGLVGQSLVKQLCEDVRYVSVITIGRSKLTYTHEKLEQRICSLDTISESDIDFAHEIFCCLGTTMKKARTKEQFEKVDFEYPLYVASLAKNRGIEHFIVISAMGASEKAVAYYSRVKGKLEKELIKLEFKRLSIIRPSLLTGAREEFRLGEKVGEAVLKVVNPLLIGPLKKVRSIPAEQVAKAMLAIALTPSKGPVTVYKSDQLLKMEIPLSKEEETQMIDREATFNWNKVLKEDVVDDEVVFDRTKIKTVDNEGK
jgi:uncharacterized protein YbjT (DUF2867 family)